MDYESPDTQVEPSPTDVTELSFNGDGSSLAVGFESGLITVS